MSIEKISARLRQARKSKGLQQKNMAEKLQISRAGYSRMETGKVEITTKNLVKIAEILDISRSRLYRKLKLLDIDINEELDSEIENG